MKENLPVTQRELDYSSSMNILSTTDVKGAVTYVNQDFLQVSGFESEELIGRNHNIVRHPDMPPAAFADLWCTVKAGQSWMGIVKNRCKNGDHYWVDAYVTPIERNGSVAEYQSVRRKPKSDYVKRAEPLYSKLKAGKAAAELKDSWSMPKKALLAAALPPLLSIFLINLINLSPLYISVLFGVSLIISLSLMILLFKPYQALVNDSKRITDNKVARYVYTGRRDDIGQLQLALKTLESETAGLVGRIADSADTLTSGASNLSSAVSQSETGARKQFAETDQVAAAINEMSASIQEVAGNAQNSSSAASGGLDELARGRSVVNASVNAMQNLKEQINSASGVIAEVKESSNTISTILNVIGDIAEQTNLLALNAAIEAARAGEAGRGFSVVADEVRSLASRTQTSTEEIRQMIEQLQDHASRAVSVMAAGQQHSEACVEQNAQTADSLNAIFSSIELISDMNTQIASAVEQQSAVAEEISRSIYAIRDMSQETLSTVETSSQTSHEMLSVSNGFSELSQQFWSKQGA